MPIAAALDDVTFDYRVGILRRRRRALTHVSVQFESGQVHGLVGVNGAGKSTLIGHLAGVLRPGSGVVRVFERPAGERDVRARVVALPEEADAGSRLRVREAVAVQAALYGHGGRARIDAALEQVGVADLAQRRLDQLSKGQRRRAAIARALVADADLLLLDEPLSGVDPLWCERLRGLFRELAQSGKTLLVSSHLLADLQEMSDAITLIDDGEVAVSGPLNEVLGDGQRTLADLLRDRYPELPR